MAIPTVDESFTRLHQAGWSIPKTALGTISGSITENLDRIVELLVACAGV